MRADAGHAPAQNELPAGLTDRLPAGAVIRAWARQGQRLILALDGVSVGLGWIDLDALDPCWRPLPPRPGRQQSLAIQALLDNGTECLAIAGDRISIYRWGERDATPECVRTVQLGLEHHQILATARTDRHVAILATRIHRRPGKVWGLDIAHDLGWIVRTHRRTELLMLLDADSLRERGAAAVEQRFDEVVQAPPPPRWTGLRLSETELQLQDEIAGPIAIKLADGPLEDLQEQIRSCSSYEFKLQEPPRAWEKYIS
jgi:hypothetical protein